MSDSERDVSKALAAFGAPPLKYRSFAHAPIVAPPDASGMVDATPDMPETYIPPVHESPTPVAATMPPPPPPPAIGSASVVWDQPRPAHPPVPMESVAAPVPGFAPEPVSAPGPQHAWSTTAVPPPPPVSAPPGSVAASLPDMIGPEMLAAEVAAPPLVVVETTLPQQTDSRSGGMAGFGAQAHPVATMTPVVTPGDLPLRDLFRILAAREPAHG